MYGKNTSKIWAPEEPCLIPTISWKLVGSCGILWDVGSCGFIGISHKIFVVLVKKVNYIYKYII
jgi:hypothetical protein